MSAITTAPTPYLRPPTPRAPVLQLLPGNIADAPLVPFALAVTAGVVADRYAGVPLAFSLLLALAGVVASMLAMRQAQNKLPLVYLAVSAAAFGAAYHHWQRDVYAPDDIGNYAKPEPILVCVQGMLDEEPTISWQARQEELRTIPQRSDPTLAVLRVERCRHDDVWVSVSGRTQLVVSEHLVGLHAGDEIEVVGYLAAPHPPSNPGEFDHAAHLRDQHIKARIMVLKTADAVQRLAERWPQTPGGWLAVIRGWGQRTLQGVGPMNGGLAMALLLGDGGTMTSADWDKYIRTGVIHVLAISGQHLVILALFLWLTPRHVGMRRRWAALAIAGFLLLYALVVGGRPPVMRSAVTVSVAAVGLFLRRPVLPANSFACAWLVIAILNPTDLANAGCQLSFLSVAILYWGATRWFRRRYDPLERLIDESRPTWERMLHWIGREIIVAYTIGFAIWLALIPLVAWRYHMITLHGLLIGPPLVLLTSIALICGFLVLGCSLLCPPLAWIFSHPTAWSLSGCEFLVDLCDRWHWARWYVPDIPEWWLWVFYGGLLSVLMLDSLYRRWRWAVLAAGLWLGIGLLAGATRPTPNEMRCTFLAVGHGGCTVIETPDGRTLLYDAGAVTGPDVTRRIIAPYLWSRGIHRIDEVFLSHADLDHFNGLPALLERFKVDRITCTPSFADKKIPGVPLTLQEIAKRRIPLRIASAGDRFSFGDVELKVLHPPAVGPQGVENVRSLVLLVRHAEHSILLTGDLEKVGLQQLLASAAPHIDVLMAPHHGSRFANTADLAGWACPRFVVSCQEPPKGSSRTPNPYLARGAQYLPTWSEGAVFVRCSRQVLCVETHLSGQRFVMRRRGDD
jgi:competence protein ComEC